MYHKSSSHHANKRQFNVLSCRMNRMPKWWHAHEQEKCTTTKKKSTQNANKFCSIESPKITSCMRWKTSRKLFLRRFILFKSRARADRLEPQCQMKHLLILITNFLWILENFNVKFVESSVPIMSLLPALSPPRAKPRRRKKKSNRQLWINHSIKRLRTLSYSYMAHMVIVLFWSGILAMQKREYELEL